jgi:hypothetical protein
VRPGSPVRPYNLDRNPDESAKWDILLVTFAAHKISRLTDGLVRALNRVSRPVEIAKSNLTARAVLGVLFPDKDLAFIIRHARLLEHGTSRDYALDGISPSVRVTSEPGTSRLGRAGDPGTGRRSGFIGLFGS